jgi:hypothetical protein
MHKSIAEYGSIQEGLHERHRGGNDVMTESSKNLLYYGDNLDVMRRHIKD